MKTSTGWIGVFLLVCLCFARTVSGGSPERNLDLVEHWAPVIFQDTGDPHLFDYLTRFDYDGDWNAWNNYDNLGSGFGFPPVVYHAAVETETHFFLSYHFFHPYDSSLLSAPSRFCDLHENDLEGVILTVRKDGSAFGSLRTMATMAHGHVFYFKPGGSQVVIGGNYPYASLDPNFLDNGLGNPFAGWPQPTQFTTADSTLYLYQHPSSGFPRPAVFIEMKGHGVGRLRRALTPAGSGFVFGEGTYGFYEGDGVLYYFDGGPAEEPAGSGYEELRYDLVPLAELWDRRHDGGGGSLYCGFFDFQGLRGCHLGGLSLTFGGDCINPLGSDCAANPPWGWSSDLPGVYPGDWFLDPALLTEAHLAYLPGSGEPGFDRYLDNVYLQGDKSVTLTGPDGPTAWRPGQSVAITWDYQNEGQGPDLQRVNLQVSRDSGPWESIATGVPIADRQFVWTVEGIDGTSLVLRLEAECDCDFSLFDTTDFAVALPTFLLDFTAERRTTGVWLAFETSYPPPGRGLVLWREVGGRRERVSDRYLAGQTRFEFLDPAAPPGGIAYWLAGSDPDGNDLWFGPARVEAAASRLTLALLGGRPNPSRASVVLRFNLPEPGPVRLGVFDLRGRLVAALVDQPLAAGEHSATWSGNGRGAEPAAAGIYVTRLVTPNGVLTRKFTLAR